MYKQKNSVTAKTYLVGFIISLVLTLEAFLLVIREALPYWILIFTVFALAVIQLFVQLFFFLHLDEESKPRWKMTAFLFAGLVVIIVVFGSLWIMASLHYNHEKSYSPEEIGKYIEEEEAIYR